MAQSEALKIAYSSSPAGANGRILRSFVISGQGFETIRLVHAYVPYTLGGQPHEPCQLSYKLPAKDATGNQKINFAIGLVDARAQRAIDAAISSNTEIFITYAEYLGNDLSAPSATPITMNVVGGDCKTLQVQIEAQYFDMLNFAWPRGRYTLDKAPGVKFQ